MGSDFYCEEVFSFKTSVEVVEESQRVVAYKHTRPHWPVHIVVVPKQHVPSLVDLGAADAELGLLHEVLEVVRRVAARVNEQYGAARVLTNLGAYQDSLHLHFHVNYGAPLS
ncbi:MAG TPA: HIT domain-containing protein [Planctomycetota bacterium]|mgnify:CR=1 FL=1|nr:HIT domain-containing protein [Planctomycetota bacterium]